MLPCMTYQRYLQSFSRYTVPAKVPYAHAAGFRYSSGSVTTMKSMEGLNDVLFEYTSGKWMLVISILALRRL